MVLDPRTPSATVGAGVGTTLAKIVPADSSGLTDAKNDLGGPSNRWKDFYLSGNVIVANGQGIDFSATAGTGTSELFDDYEEGTWTPTIEGSTTAGTQTYNAQVAKYTKVGRTVTIYAYVSITNKDAAMAGNVRIGGLPYASDGTANALQALALGDFQGVTFGVGKTQMLLRIPNNVTKINVYDGGSGLASAQIPVSNINNATYFVVGGTYQTA